MIKADIVKEIARELHLKDREALVVVDGLLESLKDAICENRRLEIRDFGVFQVKTRKERVGRNPRDKVEYPIPERQVVTFRLGKELKTLLEEAGRKGVQVRDDKDDDSESDDAPTPRPPATAAAAAKAIEPAAPPAIPAPPQRPPVPENPPQDPPATAGPSHQTPPPSSPTAASPGSPPSGENLENPEDPTQS